MFSLQTMIFSEITVYVL